MGNTPNQYLFPIKILSKYLKKAIYYGASLGKVFFAKKGAYNVAIARVIPLYTRELINKQFIYWYYNSSIYQIHIKDRSRSAQAGFNKEDMADLFFPLPPLAEQMRIVSKITELHSKL